MIPADKNKLLIYSDCYIYGGSERLLSFIVLNPLIREGYEIHFAYRRHRSYEAGLAEDYGAKRANFHALFVLSNDTLFHRINISSLPGWLKKTLKIPFWLLQKSGFYWLYNTLLFRSLIKKIDPQIIHINNGGYPAAKSCFAFVSAAKMAKVKNVVYQVNNIASRPRTKLTAWLDRRIVAKNVKYFLTASRKAQEALAQNRNFPLVQVLLLPNTTLRQPIGRNREEILKEFSWPNDSFLLCQVAFLSKRKGQIFLLEALEKIKSTSPACFEKIRLVLIGDGEEEKNLKKFVQDKGLDKNVAFAGYRADRLDFINACDIFILPSIANEDMPIVILESMSLGKTIIASRFAGIEEELENGISGILLEPAPSTLSSNIAQTIINIYNNQSTNTYGPKAKKRFDEYFSLEHHGRRLMEIYNLTLRK